jgi:hypothetical protein
LNLSHIISRFHTVAMFIILKQRIHRFWKYIYVCLCTKLRMSSSSVLDITDRLRVKYGFCLDTLFLVNFLAKEDFHNESNIPF